jgi:hypothetical protein
VEVLTTAGTAMETMESIDASCPKTKLTLRQTRRNGRKKRRRSLDLAVVAQVLEGSNMRGPSLEVVVVLISHLE